MFHVQDKLQEVEGLNDCVVICGPTGEPVAYLPVETGENEHDVRSLAELIVSSIN